MRALALSALLMVTACGDVSNPTEENESEVITTVTLDFTPVAGGDTVTVAFSDPENDGSPVVDPLTLAADTAYTLDVSFTNDLTVPPSDLTSQIALESDQHQLFFTGDATDGLLTVDYADTDANGLPVGLTTDVLTGPAGTGTLLVTLRHLPVQGGVAIKVADLAATVADLGFDAIPGDTDVQVTFDVTVP